MQDDLKFYRYPGNSGIFGARAGRAMGLGWAGAAWIPKYREMRGNQWFPLLLIHSRPPQGSLKA